MADAGDLTAMFSDGVADPEVVAATAPAAPPAPTAGGGDDLTRMFTEDEPAASPGGAPAPGHRPGAAPVAPHHVAAPTRFHQAGTPPPAATPELSWQETGQQAVQNFLPSLGQMGQVIVGAVAHPVKTAETIGNLGSGLVSQAQGALGVQQDAQTKAHTEALARALEDHYVQTYGSVKGFKRAVATDPASVLTDAATFLGGAGAVAKGAGLAKTAAVLGKTASVIDPVTNALRVASLPVKAVAKAAPVVQAFTSGASANSLLRAAQAGASADPALRAAFLSHLNGTANPAEIVDIAQAALRALNEDRSANYVAGKASLTKGELPPINWGSVNDALENAQSAVRHTDPTTGTSRVVNVKANEALDEIGKEIGFYQNQQGGTLWRSSDHDYPVEPIGEPISGPDGKQYTQVRLKTDGTVSFVPSDQLVNVPSKFGNLEGFDALKRRVGDIRNSYKNDPVAYQKATEMYNAVLDAIKAQHPDYEDLMGKYADASDLLSQLRGTFGLRSGANDEAVLRRLLGTKTSANKRNLLAELTEKAPTLPFMLAGHELSPLLPGGIRQAINFAAAPFVYGTHPALAALQAAGASPRAMGALNYGVGRAANLVGQATQPAARTAAYYAGRAAQEAQGGQEGGGTEAAAPGDIQSAILGAEGTAKNPRSSAAGPYQMIDSTWGAQFRKLYPDRAQGLTDEQVAQRFRHTPEGIAITPKLGEGVISDNTSYLQSKGIPTTARNVYAAHFLGPQTAEKVIRADPTTPLAELLPPKQRGKILAANPMLYGKTAGWLLNWANNTMAARGAAATGGRIERASGGKVGDDDVERLVGRLMSLAKSAKKATDETTKPLLKQPDEAIVRALEVAQKAI